MKNISEQNLNVVSGLKPQALWNHFVTLCVTPRASGEEEMIAGVITELALENGLHSYQDGLHNVLVFLPASPGLENKPIICLQGHLDMVCEKNADVDELFPIKLIKDGDKLTADGTTLGADNGIAVAFMMMLMSHAEIPHGPLELLFTTVEETGMDGAQGFNYSLLESKRILNLDNEIEGVLLVGSAGGCCMEGVFMPHLEQVVAQSRKYSIKVAGLTGGHSGIDINLGRGNALKILASVITKLEDLEVKLVDFEGGNAMNAIPREAVATVMVSAHRAERMCSVLDAFSRELSQQYSSENLEVTFCEIESDDDEKVFYPPHQQAFLKLVSEIPNGVVSMEPEDDSMIQTSNNLGVIKRDGQKFVITSLHRSSLDSELDKLQAQIESIFKTASIAVKTRDRFSPWEPQFDTNFLGLVKSSYREFSGQDARVETIHAGLECSIFYQKMRDVEIVSCGPTMGLVHSPQEWVSISSVLRWYNFLLYFFANS